MTKFGTITQVGRSIFLRRSATSPSNGQSPASQKFLWPLPTPKRFDLERQNLVW